MSDDSDSMFSFSFTMGGSPLMKVITLICLCIAVFHAYHANKCENSKWRMVGAIVLSVMFPKLAAAYYLFTYGLPKFDKDGMAKLNAKYQAQITPARLSRDSECVPKPSAPPLGGNIEMMFGGW